MMQSEFMQCSGTNIYLKLDPRTKLFLMLIINVAVFGGSKWYIMMTLAVIPMFLLLAGKKQKAALVVRSKK